MERPQYHPFYKRIKVQRATESISFELASGLGYLLRRFHLMQPDYKIVAGPLTVPFPGVSIELKNGSGSIRKQLQPIPAQLYSAPRKDGITTKTESAPHDLTGYGISFSANFKPRTNTVNLFFDPGETLFIDMTGQQFFPGPGIWGPDYVDIFAEGIYVP